MNLQTLNKKIEESIAELQTKIDISILTSGKQLYEQSGCTVLSKSAEQFVALIDGCEDPVKIQVEWTTTENDDKNEGGVVYDIYPDSEEWDKNSYACLLEMQQSFLLENDNNIDHKKYTREGMIRRVMYERQQKAVHADYKIKWADNIYGDHILTNERGVKYKIFLRDFDNETGYSNSKDSAINKLGTTKHIMFAFMQLKSNNNLYRRLKKTCPFIEIYCDPLNNYAVTYFYPHEIPSETKALLDKYFNVEKFIEEERLPQLISFLEEANTLNDIIIRPEVYDKLSLYLEEKALIATREQYPADNSSINATLYDYQKEGIEFACYRRHAIIADEMGLGKTIQAIGAAVLKKELFGFKKTLVVCPASLKAQWKKEIEKFTDEKAEIVQGAPNERDRIYKNSSAFFLIINYETVLRDQLALNKANIDFLILDEAQKVKNYATKTASAIHNIDRKHVLIITGTPIENRLIDLFSLMTILDPHLLGPLWEFSYKHCLFDHGNPNKINAYYNLASLKEDLQSVLLRREKRKVIEQLPNIQQQDIPVHMTPLQADYHASYASGIGQIVHKKFLTPYDLQRLQQLLTAMRMTCDSTYLVDQSTKDSPKLEELKYILLDKLDIKNSSRKVIIFSEWVMMHKLIGEMLVKNNIGYSELNGKVPVKKRAELIKEFENNDKCKVFLSTEAGGAGLNLQVADILINFELPWNPAKKNQRIGRIDRLGQRSDKLTIFNLITINSIEQQIALGLLVKQNLFESVLNDGCINDFVDFTEKGKGQFLDQMKDLVNGLEQKNLEEQEIVDKEENEYTKQEKEQPVESESEDGKFDEEIDNTNKTPDITEADIPEITEKSEDGHESSDTKPQTSTESAPAEQIQAQQMEEVLNNGMQFLSGLMKMATGKNMGIENQNIEVNKETGEVTMKFKMPKF